MAYTQCIEYIAKKSEERKKNTLIGSQREIGINKKIRNKVKRKSPKDKELKQLNENWSKSIMFRK